MRSTKGLKTEVNTRTIKPDISDKKPNILIGPRRILDVALTRFKNDTWQIKEFQCWKPKMIYHLWNQNKRP